MKEVKNNKELKPKTHKIVCEKCNEDIEFNNDDILKEEDVTGAFPNLYIKSVRCPYCHERNILESCNINGKVTTVKIDILN